MDKGRKAKKARSDVRTARKIVALLNEMLEIDGIATRRLLETRVPCRRALGDHPTIQVSSVQTTGGTTPRDRVGLLGVLNGVVGTVRRGPLRGRGLITAEGGPITRGVTRFYVTGER